MSAPLTFQLLGGATIARGTTPLADLRSRTAEALLIYLACSDRPLSRQHLADFFWDDRSQKQASANLRAVLSMLRKQVSDYLIVDRQTVAFNHDLEYSLDSAIFELEIRAIETYLNQPTEPTSEMIDQLGTILDRYQGDFLTGFHLNESRGFEEWIILVRERLRRLAVLGLRQLVQYYLENGRYQEGITYVDRLVEADPYNEEAQRQRMWLLIRTGQRNAALQSYQTFADLLDQELGVDPAPATTAVFEKIHTLTFPSPNNLPLTPTHFIGRKNEVAGLVEELITLGNRLVTIIGPGGVGKTRLALHFADHLKSFHPGYFLDGIWFVPLASIHSGHFLVTAIANAINLTFRGSASPRDQLLKHLQNREMFLILDNFEHFLVEDDLGLTLLEDILKQAPQVKLFVTSREQLNLREETIFDIIGLPYPKTLSVQSESAFSYPAIDLFLQSARRVSRQFKPEDPDVAGIVRLCQLLEGMPLGLEMAAVWVRQDNIQQIVSRLEKNLEGLSTTWRNVPERHRSLRSVFDHSWQLLTTEEQLKFASLAVFRGGFTVEAALAVADLPDPAVFQGKSLLRKEEDGRFDMHNLIRQFTAEKLSQDTSAQAQALRKHAHYFLQLLSEQEHHFTSNQTTDAQTIISPEIENIRLAWQWAVTESQIDLLDQSYLSLYLYYETRGWFQEGEKLFRETSEMLLRKLGQIDQASKKETLTLGRIQSRAGWFAYRCGLLEEAVNTTKQCEAVFRQLGAKADMAQSINDLGILLRRRGEYEKGKILLLEALALRRKLGNQHDIAATLNNLANVVRMLGDYDQAQQYLLESIELMQEKGNLMLLANAYNDLGEISRATGNYEEARKYYEDSLLIRENIDNKNGIAICLNNLGSVAHTLGDYEAGRKYAEKSLQLFSESGNKRAMPYPLSILGRIARDEADFIASFAAFRRALQACNDINYVPKALDILFELATVLEAMNQPKKAVRLLSFIAHHPKINHETKQAVDSLLNNLIVLLSPEIAIDLQENGRNDTLEDVMRSVLSRELVTNTLPKSA